MLKVISRKTVQFLLLFSLCSVAVLELSQHRTKAVGSNDFYGMYVGNDTDVSKAIPVLNDLGVKWVRLWVDVDWDSRSTPGAFQKAKDLKAAGFKVIVVFNESEVPTYSEVKAYFDWAQSLSGMKDAIDVWEILNELNLSKYWEGTASEYVNNVLKAAWDSLHPNGEKVLGGSFTAWQNNTHGTSITKKYVDAGYLNYVDYAGSHPYTKTVDQMKKHLQDVKAVYGSKPIILTEWNFKQQSNYDSWRKMLDDVRPTVDDIVYIACHYRLLESGSEGGWPGVVTTSYTPKEPFYDMYEDWPK